jgi:hypothetical protein
MEFANPNISDYLDDPVVVLQVYLRRSNRLEATNRLLGSKTKIDTDPAD